MGRRHASPTPALYDEAVRYRLSEPLTCLDLFCGCGGFTLGMQRAGFQVLAAVDVDPVAIATLRSNLIEQTHPALVPVGHARRHVHVQGPLYASEPRQTSRRPQVCR